MKKHIVVLALLTVSSNMLGMEKLKHMFGLDKDKTFASSSYQRSGGRTESRSERAPFDTVGFWRETIKALESYRSKPEFIEHAESNLKRAETIRANKGGLLSSLTGSAKSRRAPARQVERKVERKAESKKDTKKKTQSKSARAGRARRKA